MDHDIHQNRANVAFVQCENRWYAVPPNWAWNLGIAGFVVVKVPPTPEIPNEQST